MTEILATSIIMRAIIALIALVVIWGLFRALDHASGHPFKEAVEKMYESPLALAIYYGLRFVGGCVLIGLLLS